MKYTFSAPIREVMWEARSQAILLGHHEVLPGHLIAGLETWSDGRLAGVLAALQLHPDLPAATPDGIRDPDDPAFEVRELPYSGRTRSVLERSIATARDRGERLVDLEHLVVALEGERTGDSTPGRSARIEKVLVDVREALRRAKPLALALLLAWSASGCGAAEDVFDPPARVEVPSGAVLASIGALSDTAGVEVMRSVSVAALSESGRYLAVGDRSPPFLRLLDRATGRASRLGMEGDGPGELRSAWGLEFLGDSVLLVLSRGQRLERFTTGGEWLGGYNLARSGVMVSSVTEGCGGRIFVYGVPGEHRRMDTVPWIHELDLEGETASASPRLAIPGRGYDLGWGGLYGFDGTTDGVLVWHRAKEPQIGYWLACDQAPADIWSHTASPEEGLQAAFDLEDGRGGMTLTLPDTVFSGAAARGSTRIRTRRALEPSDGVPVTSFHVVGDGQCHEVELVGEWTLHDAHADGLVLATGEPFPAVRVLEWSWFERQLTPAPCSSVATSERSEG